MSKATDAADSIRRAAKQYEAFVAAADILEQIGSLDNAKEEAGRALSAARAEAEKVKGEVARWQASAIDAQTKRDAILSNAQAEVNEIKSKALSDAAEIIEKAKVEGNRLNHIATESAKSTTDLAARNCNSLADKCRVLAEELAMRVKAIDEMNEEATAAEARLVKVKKQIAKLTNI